MYQTELTGQVTGRPVSPSHLCPSTTTTIIIIIIRTYLPTYPSISVLQPLDSEGLLKTSMQHVLRALRGGKDLLLSTMEVYLKVCMYVCMYVHTHVNVGGSLCGLSFRCLYVYLCMYVCMSICMYVYMYVCMYVCMYGYVGACGGLVRGCSGEGDVGRQRSWQSRVSRQVGRQVGRQV